MKKVFLILSVLILAATVSYATIAHIASVTRFSGDIMVKHGPDLFPVAVGTLLCDGDELWFLTSRPNDSLEIRNVTLPNCPTSVIYQTDIPSSTHIIYWNAPANSVGSKDDGGGKTLTIIGKDNFLLDPRVPVQQQE
jgi:hypothetical protein